MTEFRDILTYAVLKTRLPLDALAHILEISAMPYTLR